MCQHAPKPIKRQDQDNFTLNWMTNPRDQSFTTCLVYSMFENFLKNTQRITKFSLSKNLCCWLKDGFHYEWQTMPWLGQWQEKLSWIFFFIFETNFLVDSATAQKTIYFPKSKFSGELWIKYYSCQVFGSVCGNLQIRLQILADLHTNSLTLAMAI